MKTIPKRVLPLCEQALPPSKMIRITDKLSILQRMDYFRTPLALRLLALIDFKNEQEQCDAIDASNIEALLSTLRKFETIRERDIVLAIIEFTTCALLKGQRRDTALSCDVSIYKFLSLRRNVQIAGCCRITT